MPPVLRLWRGVSLLDVPALMVGGVAGVAGHRWGAYLLVANLLVQIGSHLAVGAWAYRDVMARPWPSVPALDDWDD